MLGISNGAKIRSVPPGWGCGPAAVVDGDADTCWRPPSAAVVETVRFAVVALDEAFAVEEVLVDTDDDPAAAAEVAVVLPVVSDSTDVDVPDELCSVVLVVAPSGFGAAFGFDLPPHAAATIATLATSATTLNRRPRVTIGPLPPRLRLVT